MSPTPKTAQTAIGNFRGSAHPNWDNSKASIPLDEDHDGDIDNADTAHCVAKFKDQQSGQWRTDLSQEYERLVRAGA